MPLQKQFQSIVYLTYFPCKKSLLNCMMTIERSFFLEWHVIIRFTSRFSLAGKNIPTSKIKVFQKLDFFKNSDSKGQ